MLIETLGLVSAVIGTFVTLLFILSLIIGRNDIADIAWGVGVVSVGLVPALVHGASGLSLLILCVSVVWGARLAVRIFLRNIRKGEDRRYKVWRDTWGGWFYLRSFAQVYLLQGFLMIVVGYPLLHAVLFAEGLPLSLLSIIGLVVWAAGFFFEVVGDYQLDTYLKLPVKPTPVMESGLWKYTRHPNYFGEVTMWWGIWLMIASTPMSYLALIGPLTITFLILKVSGIPMLEKQFEGNLAFEEYKKKTSVFFPLPPRTTT